MQLILHNTRTRSKELFHPLQGNAVRLYTCGPTVYGRAHIGNLRTYVFSDILRRTLEYLGYDVTHVMNITDVGHLTSDADEGEDKLAVAAQREQRSAWDIAKAYTKLFFADTDALGILRTTKVLKATANIPEQIALIQKLEEKGFTYHTSDGIYFTTDRFPGYGDFARLDVQAQREGARVAENTEKRNPADFALWKLSPKDVKRDMEWESPWGIGFPGWHIECSAMSMKALGEQFDLHTGGIDHIPVHHTNEIAQSEAATGKKPFVNFWLHSAFLTMGEDRMGKSEGNTITLDDLRGRGIQPLVFRFYILLAHYRQTVQFRWEAVAAAEEGLERLRQFLRRITAIQTDKPNPEVQKAVDALRKTFLEAMTDDLNTPEALAALFTFVKEVNTKLDAGTSAIPVKTVISTLLNFDSILGLDFKGVLAERIPAQVQKLVSERDTARSEGDFAASDKLREAIAEKGYLVEDTAKGPLVRPK